MAYEVSVIAPCYNEAPNIPELVERLQTVFEKKRIAGEIVLVNDASRDETGAVADRLAAEHPNLVAVHHPSNRGIAEAWKTGLAGCGGELVCLIDADLQYQPEDVYRLYREIRYSHADLVQGYRSSIGRLRDSRYLLSRGLNLLLNTLFGSDATDNKSGFVLAPREVLEDILRHRYRYRYFQTFIRVSAEARGYSVREIETLFESRLLGSSYMARFPVLVILRCLIELAKAFLEYRVFHKQDVVLEDYLQRCAPSRYEETLTGRRRLRFWLFGATMPLHKWLIGRQALKYYAELKRSQWLQPDEIQELQEIKLRKLVHHAYRHLPYYRERFDELGLKPTDIRDLEDLRRLPLLGKEDVRANLYDLLSDNHDKRKVLRITTSGSTGEPFVCFADKHQLENRWAATQRSLEWTGYRFGDRQARLWHQTLGMSRIQVLRERLDAWLNRRIFIPAFEMDDERIHEFVERLVAYEPVLIDGYAEAFNFLAHYVRNQGLPDIRPRAVMSSAQMLPDQSRKIIEEAFHTEAFDKYGAREFSGIAYECEAHAGHHVVAESLVVELLVDGRPAEPGEVGEVVVTDLNNYVMPFLRYRIGDLAVAVDNSRRCACGRGLPRIGEIQGRVQAIIVGANGRYVPGTFFSHLFKDYDFAIRQYKVVQRERGRITLYVVKAPRFDRVVFETEILKHLYDTLGLDTRIDVEFVDRVPMVRTGKQQGSVSEIDLDFQSIQLGDEGSA